MRRIETQEMKLLQMDILDVIHDFCISNNINYSLGCGSLLGAIRHKGYIPWDDDIDIYLLRDEYLKLMNSFPLILKNIRIGSLERDGSWTKAYAKAYDVRTITAVNGVTKPVGVSIDIFPIDKVPQNMHLWKIYNFRRKLRHRLYESQGEPFRSNRALYRNIVLFVFKLIMLPVSRKSACIMIDKFAQKYNGRNSDFVFENCQGMLQKNRFLRSCMESFIDVPFEDRVYKSMKNYDAYLSCGFGDYMKLPPEDKRVSHHINNVYWKD